MDMNTQTKWYLIIIGAVALVSIGWFGYSSWSSNTKEGTAGQTQSFTIYADKQPLLDAALVFPEGFPSDAQKIVNDNVNKLRGNIEENPADYASWLDLAIQYKTIGDYEGARDVWEYINLAAPNQSISFQNLGNLYSQFLRDYPKAEENYLQAIKNAPNQSSAYTGLAEMYKYSYKQDTTAAVDILQKGIKVLGSPQNVDLIVALAAYYKDSGYMSDAKKYYEEARSAAKKLGNTALEQQLTTEINALQ